MESKYKYRGKVLCKVCKEEYHLIKFDKCFGCWNVKVEPDTFDKMMGNPIEAIDKLAEKAKELMDDRGDDSGKYEKESKIA